MTLSANTTQPRELTELRNHLKWFDDERRKSARKVEELEQRFAQQGRELINRERHIQDLESQLAILAERVDRLPKDTAETASHEQRIQDLEWHLSNINTQLVRLPSIDEQLASFRDEIAQLAKSQSERQSRLESGLELRLAAEQEEFMRDIRRLDEQFQSQTQLTNRLEGELSTQRGIQEEISQQVADSGARLERELLARMDSKTEMLTGSLSQLEQQWLDRQAADNQTQEQLEEIRSSLSRVIFIEQDLTQIATRVDEQLAQAASQVEKDLEEMRSRLVRDTEERLGSVEAQLANAQQSLTRIHDLEMELSKTSAQVAENLAQITTRVDESLAEVTVRVDEKLDQVTSQVDESLAQATSHVDENLAQAAARVDENLAEVTARVDEKLAQITSQVDESLAQAASRAEQEVDHIIQRLTEDLDGRLLTLTTRIEEVQQTVPPDVRQSIAVLEQRFADLGEQFLAVSTRIKEIQEIIPPDATESIAALEQRLEGVQQLIPPGMQQSLAQMEQEIELRQAAEVRLTNLIGAQEGRLAPLAVQIEDLHESMSSFEERAGRNGEAAEQLRIRLQETEESLRPQISGLGARLEQAAERLEQLSNHSAQLEGSVRSLSTSQIEIRTSVAALKEQMNHNDKDLEHQLEIWRTTLDEQKDTIDRFAQQWTILSNQYKEARMAVQNFAHWQKQLEQQRRESSEMMRVESNRMQSQWDGLLLEINERLENFEIELEQKWKNVEVEAEQKWSSARRSEQHWREELSHIDDLLVKLQEDNRNLIWRIQAAQADAIKKWPRLWLEEVEKAVELRPNRRLPASSTGSPSRAEMSVSDALEQGLIRIDYKDELDESLEQ